MKMLTILIIVTSAGMMGQTNESTGVWFEELAAPYYIFKDAGYDVTIASIAGGKVPIDPRSIEEEGDNPPAVERFMNDEQAMLKIERSPSIEDISPKKYVAVFLPGGHGTMWDFPDNERLAAIVSNAFQEGRPVAAVCHGPAGLLNATDNNGNPIVKGRKVAAFTNSEEDAVGLTDAVPFLLQTKLEALGTQIVVAEDFKPNAVQDDNLITGQNPASSAAAAQLVMDQLHRK